MSKFKLHMEQLKRIARFDLHLPQEQVNNLAQQVDGMGTALEAMQVKIAGIQRNSRLSHEGKQADISQARKEAGELISNIAKGISRHDVITDLAQRVNTRTNAVRADARKALPPDAATLASELRQTILPRLLKTDGVMQIEPQRTVEKMLTKAVENYTSNPAKAELVIGALSVGWPWVPDLPETMLAQVNDSISAQVATTQWAELKAAQGVQHLIDGAMEAALSETRQYQPLQSGEVLQGIKRKLNPQPEEQPQEEEQPEEQVTLVYEGGEDPQASEEAA